MATNTCGRIALILTCVTVLAVGCKPAKMPQLRPLSEQEAADLWNRARSYEPVGQPTVQKIMGDAEVTVICAQSYALRIDTGRGPEPVITSCGGSCKLNPGAKFADCKTSGCLSTGKTCSPLKCEGGCTLSSACKPTGARQICEMSLPGGSEPG